MEADIIEPGRFANSAPGLLQVFQMCSFFVPDEARLLFWLPSTDRAEYDHRLTKSTEADFEGTWLDLVAKRHRVSDDRRPDIGVGNPQRP